MSGSDYTLTPKLGLYKPTYDADEDQWGYHLNANADVLDNVLMSGTADARFVLKAGDTMTGSLAVNAPTIAVNAPAGQSATLALNKPASGVVNQITGLANGSMRWLLSLGESTAESGSNAGSNFAINRYSDTGAFLAQTLNINRATGTFNVNGAFNAVASRSPAGLIVDTRGNLGIGYAPPSNAAPADGGLTGGWSFAWGMSANNWSGNGYYDGTTWRYLRSEPFWQQQMTGTQAIWQYAPSGTKDAVVTPQVPMTLDGSNGQLTLSGAVAAPIVFANTVYAGRDITSEYYMRADSASCYLAFQNAYYWAWNRSTGTLAWVGNNATGMTIDAAGNLVAVGNFNAAAVTASYIHSTGAVQADSSVTSGYIRSTGAFMSDSGTYYVANNTNYYFGRSSSDGNWRIVNNGSTLTTVDTGGSFSAVGNVTAGAAFYGQSGNTKFGDGGSGRILQFQSNWYFDWNISNGVIVWVRGGAANWIMHANTSDYNNEAWVGGRGAYQDLSDERSKTDIAQDSTGLDTILNIRPIKFKRLGIKDAKLELGFSAQQLRDVLPEAVTATTMTLLPGEYPTDEPDALATSTTPIVAALVNAVRELTARIEELENAV
jgi:endosialidase-like protein